MIVSRSVLKEIRSKGTTVNTNVKEKNMPSNVEFRGNDNNFLLKDNKQNQQVKKTNKNQQRSVNVTNYNMKPQQTTTSFQSINLSNHAIQQLKPNLFNQPSIIQIRQLNLSHNQIKQILPTILVPFQYLQLLDLSYNKLQKISFPYNKMCLKELRISENKLANLNLQHLKCLQHINASSNKLIFITLPQSITHANLDNNMLANTYFIEKCINLQHLSINSNFIYDLNFNSMNQLQGRITKKTQKTKAFTNLRKIQCSSNKICHLNGFQNLKGLKSLKMDNNQLVLSRESVNQFLLLESVQYLVVGNNSQQQGVYSYEEFESILFNRLQNLKSLNSNYKNRNVYLFNQSQQQQQQHITTINNQTDNFHLFQSLHKKEINDQSTIRQNQLSMECSGQKPFRLFLDEDGQDDKNDDVDECEEIFQSSFKKPPKQESFQRIYTLGDVDDNVEGQCYNDNDNDDNDVFQKNTLSNRNQQKNEQLKTKGQSNIKSTANDYHQSNTKISSLQKSNRKIHQLQKQMSKTSSRIFIPIQNKNKSIQQPSLQITQQTKNLLKMIYDMSFIPPKPIKYSSKSLKISKRLDQDEDEYFLFIKLFQKRKGIMYLKKIYLLQENDQLFEIQSDTFQRSKDYELGFFNAPNLQQIYKKMLKNDCLLVDLIDTKMQSNLANYLSAIPGAFGCHHIAVRYLNKKASAFDQRNLTPVCYLIESKMI